MADAESECKTLALHIKNFPPIAAEDESFDMFLENKTNQENFNIEYSSTFDEAFVMFRDLTLDPSEIISRIRQEPLLGNNLTVDKANPNSRIIATKIKSTAEQDLLELYFETPKINPTDCAFEVEFDSSRHVAIVTFSDPSAIEVVLSADHSKILGSEALVRRCAYFESLGNNASSQDEEVDQETTSNAGSTFSELQDFDGNEDTGENLETSSVSGDTSAPDRGHRGRRHGRRGGQRGGRHGARRGYHSFSTDGQGEGLYERQTSSNSERMYGETGGEGGNVRSRRGWRGGGDGRGMRNWEGRRPPSGQDRDREHSENFADRGNRRGWRRPFDGRGSGAFHARDHSHEDRENQRGYRRPFGGTGRGRGNRSDSAEPRQDGLYPHPRRAGSIPSLLDQPISIPVVDPVHKEIEVRNEVNNEKCHLLTRMLREIKTRNHCNVFVDVPKHRVTLDGPESAVTAATEDVYSRLCAMQSVRLELPPAFAKKLSTRDGHRQIVEFFKNAQTQAVYYTDAEGYPMVIAGDEYSAVSAAAQLRGKIRTEEVDYDHRHVDYLSSGDWMNFVSSAQRNWFLAVEIAPRNSILVIGIADDVSAAAENIRSQLSAVSAPSRPAPAADSRQRHRQTAAVRQPPQSAQEPSEACPMCNAFFPLSLIADHADQCAGRNRQCPICSLAFPPSSTTEEFQSHVDSHFF